MKIAFIQVVCPTYKVDLFSVLNSKYGVDFYVGDKNNSNIAPNAEGIPFVKKKLHNYYFKFMGVNWLYQTGFSISEIRKYDLIIFPSSVPNILNYKIIFWSYIFGIKLGTYGLGINFQKRFSKSAGVVEFCRRILHRLASFSIVYTESIKKTLIENYNIPGNKIFVAPNTLNVEKINKQKVNRAVVRKNHGVAEDQIVISYVGRLSIQKEPSLLIKACQILEAQGIHVKLLFIGSGEEEFRIKKQLNSLADAELLGQQSEEYASEILKSSDFSIMPGMTGLAVVHSFACGVTYITVNSKLHSPEFEYIENNVNGFIVEPTPKAIAKKIAELIKNPEKKQKAELVALNFALENLSFEAQINGFINAFKFIGFIQEPPVAPADIEIGLN